MNASEKLTNAVKKKIELDALKLEAQKKEARTTLNVWTENASQQLLQDFALFIDQAALNLEAGDEPPQSDCFSLSFDQNGETRIKILLSKELAGALCRMRESPLSTNETQREILNTLSGKFKSLGFEIQHEDYSEMTYWFNTPKIVLRPCRVFTPCPVSLKTSLN